MFNYIVLKFYILLQKKYLTELIGLVAKKKLGWINQVFIRFFVWYHQVNMKEVKKSNIQEYHTFNDFFTRELHNKARKVDLCTDSMVFPCDGIIGEFGNITKNNLYQAKKHFYSLESLLAGDDYLSNLFYDGLYMTVRIPLGDYHRVHMPCNGTLYKILYVPGDLYSLHPSLIQKIPNIFARNERIICFFNTDVGFLIQILIGSTCIGNIETIGLGTVMPIRKGVIKKWIWKDNSKIKNSIVLLKGEQMGCFHLGSTVINLFQKDKIIFSDNLVVGKKIFYGTRLGMKKY